MTSLYAKPPELSASISPAFFCHISVWMLLETLLFLSLTICQDSIISCDLKHRLHLIWWLIKTFHSHSLTNNNYSNLPHKAKEEALTFYSLHCMVPSWNKKKNNLLSQKVDLIWMYAFLYILSVSVRAVVRSLGLKPHLDSNPGFDTDINLGKKVTFISLWFFVYKMEACINVNLIRLH